MDTEPLLGCCSQERSSPLATVRLLLISEAACQSQVRPWRPKMGHYGSRGNSIGAVQGKNDPTKKYVRISENQEEQLRKTYLKLALLSPEDIFINRKTFCHYFQLEHQFVRKLFMYLDEEHNGKVSWDSFVEGISICIYGSNQEKCHMLFNMFVLKSDGGDGVITEAGLTQFATSAVKSMMRQCLCYELPEGYTQKERSLINGPVRSLVDDAFTSTFPPDGEEAEANALDLVQFTSWIVSYPSILKALFDHPNFLRLKASKEYEQGLTHPPPSVVMPSSQNWMDTTQDEIIPREVSSEGFNSTRVRGDYEWCDLVDSRAPVAPAPPTRSKHVAIEYKGSVYVYGGRGKHKTLNDLWRFSLANQRWDLIKPSGRHRPPILLEHTAVLHENCMYIFGGAYSHDDRSAPLWCLNLESHEWEDVSTEVQDKIPSNRRGHSAVNYNGSMYVFGGYCDQLGATDQHWRYDFEHRLWSQVSLSNHKQDKPLPRYFHDAAVCGHAMWIYGGLSDNFERLSDFWRFDLELNTWLRVKCRPSPPALDGHRLCSIGKQLFLFGGHTNPPVERSNELWKYDFDSYSWMKVDQMGDSIPKARAHHALLAVQREISRRPVYTISKNQDKDATLKTSCDSIVDIIRKTLGSCTPNRPAMTPSDDYLVPLDPMSLNAQSRTVSCEVQLLLIGGQCSQSDEVYKKALETSLLSLGSFARVRRAKRSTASQQQSGSSVVLVNPTSTAADKPISKCPPADAIPQSPTSYSYLKLHNPPAVCM